MSNFFPSYPFCANYNVSSEVGYAGGPLSEIGPMAEVARVTDVINPEIAKSCNFLVIDSTPKDQFRTGDNIMVTRLKVKLRCVFRFTWSPSDPATSLQEGYGSRTVYYYVLLDTKCNVDQTMGNVEATDCFFPSLLYTRVPHPGTPSVNLLLSTPTGRTYGETTTTFPRFKVLATCTRTYDRPTVPPGTSVGEVHTTNDTEAGAVELPLNCNTDLVIPTIEAVTEWILPAAIATDIQVGTLGGTAEPYFALEGALEFEPPSYTLTAGVVGSASGANMPFFSTVGDSVEMDVDCRIPVHFTDEEDATSVEGNNLIIVWGLSPWLGSDEYEANIPDYGKIEGGASLYYINV